MLVDDNKEDNFIHARVIKKNNAADIVIIKESGEEAIAYLRGKKEHENEHPNLILLDINMPGMNGWEFMEEYKKLDASLQSKMVLIMLTTSDNPDDMALAKTYGVLADFKTKPLTKEILEDVFTKHYTK